VSTTISTNKLIGIVVIVVAALLLMSYVTNANYGNRAEQEIQAVYQNRSNVLTQYTLKIQEAVQVPEMYKSDFKEVLETAMRGRYGADGSRAAVQWIKENNLQFDSTSYNRMQTLIEAGRNEYQREETRLIDVVRVYKTNLGYVWAGFWLRTAGYPRIDLDKYKPIISTEVQEATRTGVQSAIKLRH
jgi:hypothetical protein